MQGGSMCLADGYRWKFFRGPRDYRCADLASDAGLMFVFYLQAAIPGHLVPRAGTHAIARLRHV